MEVTEETLKRYHLQRCSAEEEKLVEAWLALDSETSITLYELPDELSLKQEIWSGISIAKHVQLNAIRKSSFKLYVAAGSIAACLLLAFFNPFLFKQTISLSNHSLAAKEVLLEGIAFTLMPNTECDVTYPLLSKSTIQIRFNGALSIISNTQNITVNIENNSDRIKLTTGATYLAINDAEHTFISATDKELQDGLPRFFSSRINERFKLN